MKGRFLDELRGWFSGLRDLFFQRDCIVCGGVLDPGGQFVCPECLADMPLTYFWTYSENAMMERLGGFAGESGGSGLDNSQPIDGCHVYNATALFFYRHESPWCEIVRQFKYGRRESLGLWAARLLGDYLADGNKSPIGGASEDLGTSGESPKCASSGESLYCDIQAVVPVPLHWFKRWKRGFNQAEVIARGVAERLGAGMPGADGADVKDGPMASRLVDVTMDDASCGRARKNDSSQASTGNVSAGTLSEREAPTTSPLPVETRLLRRVRYTSTQTRRGASSRRQNIRGAFAVNPDAIARLKAAGVHHILLVDDVLTTGATLSECIRLLQRDFTVSVATLGFVE